MNAPAKITWESDTRKVEADNARLIKQIGSLKEQLRQVKVASKESTDSWTAGLENIRRGNDKWAQGMSRLAATSAPFRKQIDTWKLSFAGLKTEQVSLLAATEAYLGPAAALSAVTTAAGAAAMIARQAYTAYRTEIDAATAAHREHQAAVAKDVAFTRSGTDAAGVESFLGSVSGIKKGDVRSALSGVTAEMPTAAASRQQSIAAGVSRLAPTGADLGAVGRLAGQLGDVLPGVSGENVADRAALLMREAGGDISKFGGDKMQRAIRQLIASGKSPDEAVAMALSAAQGKISPDTLGQIAGGGKPSREQAAEIKRLTPESVAANLAMVKGADSQDVVGGILQGMGTTSAGRDATRDYAASQLKGARRAGAAESDQAFAQLNEAVRGASAGKGPLNDVLTEASIGLAGQAREINSMFMSNEQKAGEAVILRVLTDALLRNTQAIQSANRQRAAVNTQQHVEP